MRRMRGIRLAAGVLALGLGLAACGDDPATTPGDAGMTSGAAQSDLKVGLAYDIGGRGDQSFNDSAARGLDKAKSELGFEATELEAAAGETDAQKEDRLQQLAEGGFNTIIAVGFAYAVAVGKVAAEYPDIKFAIVDDASDASKADNIANLTFAENEGSFLVGAAAALKSTTGKVGFIGGVNVPLIQKFEAGFTAGVKAAKPEATIEVKYLTQPPDFTGFNDPAKGETAANGMFDNGVDVIYAAAGGSGNGVFKAAKAKGALGIGVDSDQYNQPALAEVKDVIITSMLKQVDVAVYDFLAAVNDDTFKAGEQIFDLKADGVGYSKSGGKLTDIEAALEEFKAKIIAGEIKVPATI